MPWQRVTHTYHERWYIFMELYFEIHQLPWFKAKWKKTLANPQPFSVANIGETDLLSRQYTTQEIVVTNIVLIPSTLPGIMCLCAEGLG